MRGTRYGRGCSGWAPRWSKTSTWAMREGWWCRLGRGRASAIVEGCVGGAAQRSIFGEGRRRWRALDVGMARALVQADAPRVRCRDHGMVVCAVPWARHASRFTRAAEAQICWLAVHTSKTAVAE